MRERLQKLTVEEVNAAITRHLSARDLSIVMVAKDAASLKQTLTADAFSPIKYDGEKPQALLDEDRVIGARKLDIAPARVHITPIADVFAR
jgi:zinc protease